MNFKDNKAIYLQIADHICDRVLSGELVVDGKVPSVRETAASLEVNANTVARSYEFLQNKEIIYTRRGLGYFVATGAREIILEMRRAQLLQGELHEVFSKLAMIGMSPAQLTAKYQDFLKTIQS